LATLLPALQVTALHCNREYPLNEQRRDAQVQAGCKALGIAMHIHDDQMLLPPERVLNKSGQPFKVFTPWSKAVRELLQPAALRVAASPPPQASAATTPLPALPQLRQLEQLS